MQEDDSAYRFDEVNALIIQAGGTVQLPAEEDEAVVDESVDDAAVDTPVDEATETADTSQDVLPDEE